MKTSRYFLWDFGDGTAPIEGKEVQHTYTELGEYTVKIIASISENSCDSQEDITFDIEVLESGFIIEGIDKVCPLVEEHWYEAVDRENVSSIDWIVEGGEIVETDEYRVLIRWGEPNPEAKLSGTPKGNNGCPGKPVEFLVNINQIIEPGLPKGPIQICFDSDLIYEYEVDQVINGRNYEWFITGGEIIGSNIQSVIEVRWNQPGITGKVWYREYSENDELCEGVSGELAIMINTEIRLSISSAKDIHCNGNNTGEIIALVEGGDGDYTFTWSHDSDLNLLQGKDLPAGIYTIKAIDGQGCEAEIEVTLNEPPLLQAALVSTEMTSCFGREDGLATVTLTGGTPPYRYAGQNYMFNGNRLELSFLPMGNQTIVIYDAVDCEVQISYNIGSPMPLEVDVRVLKPACPGEANGELVVTPYGGVAPYLVTWDYLQSDGQELIGVPSGEYTATIVDDSGCISFGTGMVNEEAPQVRMPSGFRPGDGGVNGIYEGVSNCNLNYHLSIFNRWGELIYSGSEGWDGTVNGIEALPDAYTFIIKYNYFMDGQNHIKENRGIFTLLR